LSDFGFRGKRLKDVVKGPKLGSLGHEGSEKTASIREYCMVYFLAISSTFLSPLHFELWTNGAQALPVRNLPLSMTQPQVLYSTSMLEKRSMLKSRPLGEEETTSECEF